MVIFLTIIHVIVCLFLVIVVLLQSGKAADLAGAFGGMGSQTAFGPRGSATVLSKATTIAAVLFMITCLSLSKLATQSGPNPGSTVLEKHVPAPPAKGAPQQGQPIQINPGDKNVTIPVPAAPPAGQSQAPASTPAAPAKK
ncbi:MAG: preprotein translocase subunit SecG [Candidatus Solibacter usitatus]|nr:preprotein translocase subunit SecG [Candidatus Solibacter usitatus]